MKGFPRGWLKTQITCFYEEPTKTQETAPLSAHLRMNLKLQLSIQKENISARAFRKDSLLAITAAARQRKGPLWCLWKTGVSACADTKLWLQLPSDP